MEPYDDAWLIPFDEHGMTLARASDIGWTLRTFKTPDHRIASDVAGAFICTVMRVHLLVFPLALNSH
jgi:hypothetical protein